MAEIEADILRYAGWSKDDDSSGLGVAGIFFDETPNLNSNIHTTNVATYLGAATKFVKGTDGILGNRMVRQCPV